MIVAIKHLRHISTTKGDEGLSRNYSNEELPKDDVLFETLGTIDELSAFLGLTFHHAKYEHIKNIQDTLQAINSLIATNPQQDAYKKLRQINERDIEFIEDQEEKLLLNEKIENRFYLPGSETTLPNAYFDYARTICRRGERIMVHFINERDRQDLAYARKYLNRLSDLLFILARNYRQ